MLAESGDMAQRSGAGRSAAERAVRIGSEAVDADLELVQSDCQRAYTQAKM